MKTNESQDTSSGVASAIERKLRAPSSEALPAPLQPVLRSAKKYASDARARRTREEYAKQWRAFVTEAKQDGADDAAIMDQAGHKSPVMVQRYHRPTKKWEKPASARRGLLGATRRWLSHN